MAEGMQQLWQTMMDATSGYLPRLAAALAVLLAFWLAALVLSAVVRAGLRRTEVDNKVGRWLTGKPTEAPVRSEVWVARAVYYLVIFFGLIAFFSALGLGQVAEPLERMLTRVFEYLPRLISGVLLLVLAYVVASVLRFLVGSVLGRLDLDRKLGAVEAEEAPMGTRVSDAIANAIYWLVFLLFLPLVLNALALEGLLQPLQTMFARFLGFLPNLFAAAMIFFVGWLAARIVRQVLTNLLAAAGVDRAGQEAGLGGVLGQQNVSGLVGVLAYALILIPVAIASLDALQLEAVSRPAADMLSTMLQAIPALLTAALILVIAYLLGRFLSALTSEVLGRLGFDNVLERLGLRQAAAGQKTPSQLAGYLVFVAVVYFASIEAARQLGLEALASLLIQFAQFAGHVLLGLVIFAVGLWLANLATSLIQPETSSERRLLATLARVAILLLAGAMALREMGLAEEIITLSLGLVLGAVAVATAIAFGLGGRELASRQLERWIESVRGKGGGA